MSRTAARYCTVLAAVVLVAAGCLGSDVDDDSGSTERRMRGLAADPVAARAYFGGLTADPDVSGLDELLTERNWSEDALDSIGAALVAATTGAGRDGVSARIASQVVAVLGTDVDVIGLDRDVRAVDVVPPSMRDSMAEMLSTYIGDVTAGVDDRTIEFDPAIPGDDLPHASFAAPALVRVLVDFGKDDGAFRRVVDAHRTYVASAMEWHAGRGEPDSEIGDAEIRARLVRMEAVGRQASMVVGALDFGYGVYDHNGSLVKDLMRAAIWRHELFSGGMVPPDTLREGGDPARPLVPLPQASQRTEFQEWRQYYGKALLGRAYFTGPYLEGFHRMDPET